MNTDPKHCFIGLFYGFYKVFFKENFFRFVLNFHVQVGSKSGPNNVALGSEIIEIDFQHWLCVRRVLIILQLRSVSGVSGGYVFVGTNPSVIAVLEIVFLPI